MKRYIVASAIVLGLMLGGCSSDTRNKIDRTKVEMLDDDYTVTYTDDNFSKTWNIVDGKVTTSPKGYYFFWATTKNSKGKEVTKYVQVPISRTFYEKTIK